MTDLATGLYAHGAIMAALIERQKTGRGQRIQCNLLSSQVGMFGFGLLIMYSRPGFDCAASILQVLKAIKFIVLCVLKTNLQLVIFTIKTWHRYGTIITI